jgi:Tol biopolymer transport system component
MKKNISLLILLIAFSTSIIGQIAHKVTYNKTNVNLKDKTPFDVDKINSEDNPVKKNIMGDFEFDIKNTSINSNKNEYGSGFFKDRYIVVSSKKIGALGGKKDPYTGEHQSQLFCASIENDGDLNKLILYSKILNTKQNEGSLTFSPDEKTTYFTRNKFTENNNYQLFRAKDFNGYGQWKEEEEIHFSSKDYSIEDVYLNNDGSKLYFSSNMKGGYGGYDLYVAEINSKGQLGNPKNLGKNINTPLNERHPFKDKDNYIYFSSDSYNSIGGLDIFRAKKKDKG